ncbi:MAG TPA: RimK family alpha-L-glutamate ligase [Xanthobacteraceae bacterium]|nr:RimK family alpha-L-glutamate ligase [Xanthobacteraceae bacterium]
MPRSRNTLAVVPAASAPIVALVSDGIDWHARTLTKALAAQGVRTIPTSLQACGIATQGASGLNIAGLGDRLPDAVLVRSMSGGTFQAVTLRLGILHALRANGVVVWNDARAIEHCVDKSMTSFLLARAGISTPAAWAVETQSDAQAIVRRESPQGPLVLKPLFGSQGRGLKLIRTADELPAPDEVAGVYYLQRYVGVEGGDGFRDFRLLVSRGRVVAAMTRHAAGWITNVKQGGRPLPFVPDKHMKALAVHATHVVGAEFAGVDILHGPNGRPTVLEVNSMPAWSGLQKVTRASIARVLAGDLVAALAVRTERGATA